MEMESGAGNAHRGCACAAFARATMGPVSEYLPDLPEPPERRPGGGALARRRASQVEPLTPEERHLRRRNRRLMAWVAIPGLLLGTAALVASVAAGGGPAAPRPVTVPAGYRAVNDGVFAYAVPDSWSKNLGYSDDTGDLDFSGADGWAGEYLGARQSAPTAADRPPASFAVFGENRPTPYTLGPAQTVRVAGTTVAYRYWLTRPDGFDGVVIHAWQSSSGAEIWMLVRAPQPVADTVVGTLRGS